MKTLTNDSKPLEETLPLHVQQIRKMAIILRAANHPLRQQIMYLLHRQPRITVTEIFQQLGLEQSIVSQHLAILRRAGFVKTTREGKFIRYTLNLERLQQLDDAIKSFLS